MNKWIPSFAMNKTQQCVIHRVLTELFIISSNSKQSRPNREINLHKPGNRLGIGIRDHFFYFYFSVWIRACVHVQQLFRSQFLPSTLKARYPGSWPTISHLSMKVLGLQIWTTTCSFFFVDLGMVSGIPGWLGTCCVQLKHLILFLSPECWDYRLVLHQILCTARD